MENLSEVLSLDMDEANDLTFKIKLEGASASPAKVRLVCEGEGLSYMFNGYGTGEPEVVQFTIPAMTTKMAEGTYGARVEVLVENRYFAPLQFQINFKKTMRVVAESIGVRPRVTQPDMRVTATPMFAPRPPSQSTIKFEQRPVASPRSPVPQRARTQEAETTRRPTTLREAYARRIAAGQEDRTRATSTSRGRNARR